MASEHTEPPLSSDASSDASPDRRGLRVSLWIALAVSAGAALFAQPRVVSEVREGDLAPLALWVAPAAFTLVIALTALDAWRTARRLGYFPGRSVLLIGAAAGFIALLLPQTFSEYRTRTSPPAAAPARYEALAAHKDARVRAVVMELAGLRPVPDSDVKAVLARGLEDGDPLVRAAAIAAVERRTGGTGLDLAAARARVAGWP